MPEITIVDVIRDLGVEVTNDLTWSVGPLVRDVYEGMYGRPPEKELRQKTHGGGSHCFAVYPDSMRPVIATFVRQFQTEAARQGAFQF